MMNATKLWSCTWIKNGYKIWNLIDVMNWNEAIIVVLYKTSVTHHSMVESFMVSVQGRVEDKSHENSQVISSS